MKLTIGNKDFFSRIFILMVIFVFLLPNTYLETFRIYLYLRWMIAISFGGFLLVGNMRECLKNPILDIIGMYYFYHVILQAFLNQESFAKVLIIYGWPFFVLVCLDYAMKRYMLRTMKTMTVFYFILITWNLVVLLVFPNGIWHDVIREGYNRAGYVFGIGNQFAYYVLPICTILISNFAIVKCNQNLSLCSVFLALLTLLSGSSSTGKIIAVLFALMLLAGSVKEFTGWITLKRLLYLYGVIWFLMVVLQNILNVFGPIVQIFGKDVTFSARTPIWSESLNVFLESPLFGHGYVPGGGFVTIGSITYGAHNVLLQTLLEGGILGLGLLVASTFKTIQYMEKVKKNKQQYIMAVGIFSIWISFMMESYSLYYYFVTLIVTVNISNYANSCCQADMQ